MISRKLNNNSLVIVPVAATLLGAGILLGYANYPRIADGWDPGGAKTAKKSPGAKDQANTGPAVNGASAEKAEPRAAKKPAAPSWPPAHAYPVCHREERNDVAIAFPHQRSLP